MYQSKMAIQNSHTKLWDVYGSITAIRAYHQYYIKSAGGVYSPKTGATYNAHFLLYHLSLRTQSNLLWLSLRTMLHSQPPHHPHLVNHLALIDHPT